MKKRPHPFVLIAVGVLVVGVLSLGGGVVGGLLAASSGGAATYHSGAVPGHGESTVTVEVSEDGGQAGAPVVAVPPAEPAWTPSATTPPEQDLHDVAATLGCAPLDIAQDGGLRSAPCVVSEFSTAFLFQADAPEMDPGFLSGVIVDGGGFENWAWTVGSVGIIVSDNPELVAYVEGFFGPPQVVDLMSTVEPEPTP